MHADLKDRTNILNRQYVSVYTREDTSNVPSPSGQPYQPMEEIVITEQGVRKLLQKMTPRKACGPDMRVWMGFIDKRIMAIFNTD